MPIARQGITGAVRAVALALALGASLASAPAAAATVDDQVSAWVARDAATLRRAAPRLADGAIAPIFDAMDRRVGAYADWVYGWFSSLLIAWDLAYAGATEAGTEIARGAVPDPGRLHARMAAIVQSHFEETVVKPERTTRALDQGWRRAMERLAGFDARLAADRRTRIERLAERLGVAAEPVILRYGGPILNRSIVDSVPPADLANRSLSDVEAGAGGTADRVLVRSVRPLVTRALSVTTRLLLAPLAGGIVASPIVGTEGVGAAVMTLAAVSAGVWGIDYAANRIDSALTRPGFETSLRALVRDAHAVASRLTRQHADAAFCAAAGGACATPPTLAAPRPAG